MSSRRWFLKSGTNAALGAGLLAAVRPLAAHHSTTMYNMDNPVTVTGTVKRFEWTNPHAFIYLAVKDENGKEVEWAGGNDEPEPPCAPSGWMALQ